MSCNYYEFSKGDLQGKDRERKKDLVISTDLLSGSKVFVSNLSPNSNSFTVKRQTPSFHNNNNSKKGQKKKKNRK